MKYKAALVVIVAMGMATAGAAVAAVVFELWPNCAGGQSWGPMAEVPSATSSTDQTGSIDLPPRVEPQQGAHRVPARAFTVRQGAQTYPAMKIKPLPDMLCECILTEVEFACACKGGCGELSL